MAHSSSSPGCAPTSNASSAPPPLSSTEAHHTRHWVRDRGGTDVADGANCRSDPKKPPVSYVPASSCLRTEAGCLEDGGPSKDWWVVSYPAVTSRRPKQLEVGQLLSQTSVKGTDPDFRECTHNLRRDRLARFGFYVHRGPLNFFPPG